MNTKTLLIGASVVGLLLYLIYKLKPQAGQVIQSLVPVGSVAGQNTTDQTTQSFLAGKTKAFTDLLSLGQSQQKATTATQQLHAAVELETIRKQATEDLASIAASSRLAELETKIGATNNAANNYLGVDLERQGTILNTLASIWGGRPYTQPNDTAITLQRQHAQQGYINQAIQAVQRALAGLLNRGSSGGRTGGSGSGSNSTPNSIPQRQQRGYRIPWPNVGAILTPPFNPDYFGTPFFDNNFSWPGSSTNVLPYSNLPDINEAGQYSPEYYGYDTWQELLDDYGYGSVEEFFRDYGF